jgi:hypothetical protein
VHSRESPARPAADSVTGATPGAADDVARWGPPPERLPVGPSFSVDHVDLVNVALFTPLTDKWALTLVKLINEFD